NEENKDVAPKFERRRIDDIIDFIRDKYGWSEEIRWNEANTVDIVPTGNEDNKDVAPKIERRRIDDIIEFIRISTGVEDDKEDEIKDDKDQEEEEEKEDDNDEKEQDDNNGSDDETWIPNKEATSSSRRSKKKKVVKRGEPLRHCIIGLCSPKTYDMIGKKDFGIRKEDDKKDVNENKARVI
nr:hypothetical protein [Tanacetum cinerariifolium]